jgi:hypothetical protein
MKTRKALLLPTLALAGLLALGVAAVSASSGKQQLHGTLKLTAGKVSHGKYTGTFFRMLTPNSIDQYFPNPQSTAPNKTYTLMRPGSGGGLKLGAYQAPPSPAFSGSGDALASKITKPQSFAAIKYSISTASKDAQTGGSDPVPTLYVTGTKLSGNFSAWTAEWNKIYFNQGSPKPGNKYPGETTPVTGTYNKRTKQFTIIWQSAIVGGPFNGFTGFWHLQGKLS